MPMPRKPRGSCPACGQILPRPLARFCDNRCQQEHQYHEYIRRWQAGLESGNIARGLGVSGHVRRYLFAKFGGRCSRCGWDQRHPVTGRVPLTVEHLDGDPTNSSEANLDLICPNCHALTASFGALNKGRGRKARKNMDGQVHRLWRRKSPAG